jgi:tRNA G46 methylase TrmB
MVLFMTFSRETVSTVQQLTKKVDLRNAELLPKNPKTCLFEAVFTAAQLDGVALFSDPWRSGKKSCLGLELDYPK